MPGARRQAPGTRTTAPAGETPRALPCYAAPSVVDSIILRCAEAALAAGRAIRTLVHAMDPRERARERLPLLKPDGGYGARHVDAEAERVGLAALEQLTRDTGCAVEVIVDPAGGVTHRIGRGAQTIWASMDAIDGTVKVAGLGERLPDRVRIANDGGWAAGFAFTEPTDRRLGDLTFGDFVVAVVVDGNPTRWRAYPQDLVTHPTRGGLVTFEATERPWRRVFTTTGSELSQLWTYLDVFQAYDLDTRRPGDEAVGIELYRLLTDRHRGGAFDVLRQYANLSALGRVLFGWREPPAWLESQGGGYLVVNENVPNLIPSVPLVAGAGGISVDFAGRSLRERRLADGRTSVLHAANEPLCRRLLEIVDLAQRRATEAA
jgi:hypothetical protein